MVGGGASGAMAAIQASRLGVKSIVLEETTWLGGIDVCRRCGDRWK